VTVAEGRDVAYYMLMSQ